MASYIGRRKFLATLGGAAGAWPLSARAQQPGKLPMIVFLVAGTPSSHGPWVAGDYVFVLANDNALVCLTRKEGKVRWVHQLPRYEDEKSKSDPIRWAGPVLGGNRLIVLSSLGEAVSVSPETGQPFSSQSMSSGGFLGPVIAGNTLYLLTDDANLSAYR